MRHFANWIYVITYVIKHLSLSLKIQFKMAKLTHFDFEHSNKLFPTGKCAGYGSNSKVRRSNRKLVVSKHFHESEKIRDILNLSSSWLFCWKNAHLKFDIGNSGYTIASYHMYKLSINCLISFNSLYLFWSTRKLHMLKKQLRSILWICSI